MHVLGTVSQLAIRFGSRTRWTLDDSPEADWADVVLSILGQIHKVIAIRDSSLGQFEAGEAPYRDIAMLEIYNSTNRFTPEKLFSRIDELPLAGGNLGLSFSGYGAGDTTTHTLSKGEQRRLCHQLGEHLQAYMRERSGLGDEVVWRPSFETPVCAACGTGGPR